MLLGINVNSMTARSKIEDGPVPIELPFLFFFLQLKMFLYYFINFLLQPCEVAVSTTTLEEETGSERIWDLFILA